MLGVIAALGLVFLAFCVVVAGGVLLGLCDDVAADRARASL